MSEADIMVYAGRSAERVDANGLTAPGGFQTKLRIIRSRSRAAFARASEFVWLVRAKLAVWVERAVICSCASDLRAIPTFSVEGSDLIHEVRSNRGRQVLGSELLVPTLEGKVRLKIPPGTQGRRDSALRERGLPGVSGKRGDLYVEVQINLPKKTD